MDQASRNNAIARHLTVKYLLTLGLLGGTALANYLILRTQIAASRSVAEVVDLSGRQRALLQRSALLAHEFALADGAVERRKLRDELATMVEPMKQTYHGLIRSDSTVPPPESVHDVSFNSPWLLDTEVRNFVAQLGSLIEAHGSELGGRAACPSSHRWRGRRGGKWWSARKSSCGGGGKAAARG